MNEFSLLIFNWYRQVYRNLPWRHTDNPYFIWISEIILQQTKVEQGKSYYTKFIEKYPTVQDLAKAEEQEVLKMWQGLGYYSRARNMLFAARQIVNDFGGVFPSDYTSIRSLKGVGEYTAAAIASFAFHLPYPAVDGNVLRVLSRFYADATPIDTSKGKKLFTHYAKELIDEQDPATFNQAMMELGATVCTPRNPKCKECPIMEHCQAFRDGNPHQFPVKSKKIKVKTVYFNYLIYPSSLLQLQKRKGKGIWENLFQFPLIESSKSMSKTELQKEIKKDWEVNLKKKIATTTHILSHRKILATFWEIDQPVTEKECVSVSFEELEEYPLPRLIDRFITQNKAVFKENTNKRDPEK